MKEIGIIFFYVGVLVIISMLVSVCMYKIGYKDGKQRKDDWNIKLEKDQTKAYFIDLK